MSDLLLTDALVPTRSGPPERADVSISGDRIVAVSPPGSPPHVDGTEPPVRVDVRGRLLLPAPAEPHTHLDKALSGDRAPNPAGTLPGAIEAWLGLRATIDRADYVERATAAAERFLANGCTAIRTHVDLGPDLGTSALEALLEVKAAMAGRVAIQLVGLIKGLGGSDEGAALDLLARAADLGLDVVGGVPHVEDDPVRAVEQALETAGERGLPVDLHADENLRPDSVDLATLADRVLATGFEPGVTASHCVSLGMVDAGRQAEVAARVAEAGISVVTLPQTNLYLQGHDHPVATPRGLTAVAALVAAGVNVAAGADNVRDPFNPVGRADPLEIASLVVVTAHRPVGEAFGMVTRGARRALGLEPGRVEPGAPAELLALPVSSIAEAVAEAPGDRLVVHRGRVVAGS